MQTQQVLIYQDYIHNHGQLYTALARYFGHGKVGFCDAADILSGCLNPSIRLFVMPGGADIYYCEKLNGAGNALIQSYVAQGGAYLGICAGAYYGCAALDWAGGTGQEISGMRELGFYNGVATGPLYDMIEDGDLQKSWRCAAPLIYDDGDRRIESRVLYEGGPVFTGGDGTILARYSNNRAAIIECRVGDGVAILSSPHIEIMTPILYAHRNNSFDYEQKISALLESSLSSRRALWDAILNRLVHKKDIRHDAA